MLGENDHHVMNSEPSDLASGQSAPSRDMSDEEDRRARVLPPLPTGSPLAHFPAHSSQFPAPPPLPELHRVDSNSGTRQCLDLLTEFAGKLRSNNLWDTDHDDDGLVRSLTALTTQEDRQPDYAKTMADLNLLEGFVTMWMRASDEAARLMAPHSKGKTPLRPTSPAGSASPLRPQLEHQAAGYFEQFPTPTARFPEPSGSSSSMLYAATESPMEMQIPRLAPGFEEPALGDSRVHICYTEVVADPNDDMAINIKLMDRVRLEIEMDDHVTGIGTNLNTGAMGSFPLSCLNIPSDVDLRPRGSSGSPERQGDPLMSLPPSTPTDSGRGIADALVPQFTAHHINTEPLMEDPLKPVPLMATHSSVSDGSAHRSNSGYSLVSRSSAGSGRDSLYWDRASAPNATDIDDLHGLPVRGASIQSAPPSLRPSPMASAPVGHTLDQHASRPSSIHEFPVDVKIGRTPSAPRLPFALSAQVLEKRKYAQQVIAELYETERNFRDGMQVLIDQFMLPLGQACISSASNGLPSESEQVITKMEHSVLFRNIPGLRNLSRKICGLLQLAMARAEYDQQGLTGGGAVGAVVDVFLLNVEFEEWSTYVRFMEGFAHSKTTLDNLKKREPFRTMIQKCESAKECNRHSFDHYIILPVQRISRYHLLLSRLKQVTDEEDPVHQSIETAEQYMKQIGDVLEAVQKQEEELRRIFSVFSEIKGCPPDIISASRRRLLSAFGVEELFSGRMLMMHVFSDCFLISTESSDAPYSPPTTFDLAAVLAKVEQAARDEPSARHSSNSNLSPGKALATSHANLSVPNVTLPSRTASATSSKFSVNKRAVSHYHYKRDKEKDKDSDRGPLSAGGPGSSGVSASVGPKYAFVARVLLRELEVQSVEGDSCSTLSRAAPSVHPSRVVVLRHVPGSGVSRAAAPAASQTSSTFAEDSLYGYGSADTRPTASPPIAHPHQHPAPLQALYAFRARDSRRMAGLLAALGLAGVKF
ncbi:Protein T2 [Geranomyces variabilis]|nr:Protein T2 [Geranomyces variabilis]